MSKFETILILSSFVVLTVVLGDKLGYWPVERYESSTCSSTNTEFCLSCEIVAICLLQSNGDYTEIVGTCPPSAPCFNGQCSTAEENPACSCVGNAGITYKCDPNNPQYYVLCVFEDASYLECPTGQVFDCNSLICVAPTTTTTTTTTTTPSPPPCTEVGVFPSGCTDFLVCTSVGQPPTEYSCDEGQFFDPNINNCAPNEPFDCTTAGITGDYRDPYDCQRYYVCSGEILVFTDCCYDGFYYDDSAGVSSCQPNNGECAYAIECTPSAARSPFKIYEEFDKWKNFDLGNYFLK